MKFTNRNEFYLYYFRPQLLDLAAAAQTDSSHSSAVEVLNFKSDAGLDLAERYLMAVSLATHPSEFLLQGTKFLSDVVF